MNDNVNQTSNEDLIAKYKRPLQESVEKLSTEVANYNFKPIENHFFETNLSKTIKGLNGFTILSLAHRFFYTDKNTRVTYITNVIVDKSETLFFSKDKTKYKIFGQEEFSFDELEKKSYENVGVNRKIILIGIYEGKLTKIEASVISERNVLSYIKNNENEPTADICGSERQYKDNVTSVLSLVKSKKPQLNLSESDEMEYFQELDTHIKTINKNLYISGNIFKETKKYVASDYSHFSQAELEQTLSSSYNGEDLISETSNEEIVTENLSQETSNYSENDSLNSNNENLQISFDFSEKSPS